MGNLEDITYRVVRILGEVDLVAAEDTRRAQKLLTHYGLSVPLASCHQHSSCQRIEELVSALLAGKSIALLSDAGTPTVSDPGLSLVRAALAKGIEVDPLPGPCAAITALSASGFPLATFSFQGFLPRKGREKAVSALAAIEETIVFYESPRRIAALLVLLEKHLPQREVLLARELTKIHQQLLRGKPGELLNRVREEKLERGEYTVVLGPGVQAPPPDEDSVLAAAQGYLAKKMSARDVADRLSAETGLSRRQVYAILHKKKEL